MVLSLFLPSTCLTDNIFIDPSAAQSEETSIRRGVYFQTVCN